MKNNNQKIIIIEGHDKSGKTSLIEKLSNELQIPSYKRVNTKGSYDFLIDLHYSVDTLTLFLEQSGHSVIFDRLYPSEYVYSKLF